MSEHENAPGRRVFSSDEQEQLTTDLDAARRAHLKSRADEQPELVDTGSQNITGYRPQPPNNRDLVNEVKQMELNFASWMEQVYFTTGANLDPRQVASARTHLEYAFYHLVRAVFQPADPIGDAVKDGPQR